MSDRSGIPPVQLCHDDMAGFLALAGGAKNILWSPKLDGFRCPVMITRSGEIVYGSRSGLRYPDFGLFDSRLLDFTGSLADKFLFPIIFDAELTATDGRLETVREIVQGRISPRYGELVLNIFDLMSSRYLPLRRRISALARGFQNVEPGPVRVVAHSDLPCPATCEAVIRLRDESVACGHEGIVLKLKDAPYKHGKSLVWCRSVPFQSADLAVVEAVPMKDDPARLSALVCEMDGARVRVGTGFTAAQRREFVTRPPEIAEIFHRGRTVSGKLRNPIFRRPRPDKCSHALT